jgi:NitT/TauT family transport system ATP-binding protein
MWLTDKRTVIFVTHDVDEALLLGNDIIVLSRPPVKIITKKQLDLPLEERRLDSDSFRELKRNLMSALGNQ